MALLAALLFVVCLGGILPQVNPELERDPAAHEQWLSQTRSRWGRVADLFQVLGLLSIFDSPSVRILFALVAVASLVRLFHHCLPSWIRPPSGRTSSFLLTLHCDSTEAWRRITRALAPAGLRLSRRIRTRDLEYAVARRTGLSRAFPGLFYLGVLVLLLATLVGWRFGWRGAEIELVLGETRVLDRRANLAVRLDEIEFLPGKEGTMRRFDSRLSLLGSSKSPQRVTVGQGQRAAWGGLSLYQLGYGPAVRVTVEDEQGRPLNVQRVIGDTAPRRVLRERFSGQQQEQLLAVPEADLLLRLLHYPTLPGQGIPGRALHVQVYRGADDQLVAEQFLDAAGRVIANDLAIDLAFEYYVALRIEKEPELPFALVGGVLVLLGTIGFFAWPPREVWIAVREAEGDGDCRLDVLESNADAAWFMCVKAVLSEQVSG